MKTSFHGNNFGGPLLFFFMLIISALLSYKLTRISQIKRWQREYSYLENNISKENQKAILGAKQIYEPL